MYAFIFSVSNTKYPIYYNVAFQQLQMEFSTIYWGIYNCPLHVPFSSLCLAFCNHGWSLGTWLPCLAFLPLKAIASCQLRCPPPCIPLNQTCHFPSTFSQPSREGLSKNSSFIEIQCREFEDYMVCVCFYGERERERERFYGYCLVFIKHSFHRGKQIWAYVLVNDESKIYSSTNY